jgi:transcriptional regulator with XRE-family HTH domain
MNDTFVFMALFDIAEYIHRAMDERDMTQADLVRKSGLSSSQVSKILSMKSEPSAEAMVAIAHALEIPPETVFRAAGLLPPINPITEYQEILDFSLSSLDGDQLMEVLQFIEFVKQRDKAPAPKILKPKREGAAPPETFNK